MGLFFAIIGLILVPAANANAVACNGSPKLCNMRYDQVVYPTTHNATSVRKHELFISNQEAGVHTQMKEGIRAFMIDAWYYNGFDQIDHHGEVYTCHKLCALGGKPLIGVLNDMKKFLDENPNEVLTIIFESHVRSSDMELQFAASGLLRYVFAQPQHATWPTLGQMIQQNRRLVVFTENQDHGPDWYMDAWAYTVETPFTYSNTKQFTCSYGRGNPQNSLFILNHFLTVPLFRYAASHKANRLSSILGRARKCMMQDKKIPNFLTVDFYRSSAVLQVADILNQEY